MIIHEYRVVLPLTVEEYKIAQRYTIMEVSKEETGGGEGIEILKNEPFNNVPLLNGKYTAGQYTQKVYHLNSKLPTLIRLMAPRGSKEIHEESWSAYPYTKTVLTNPDYMKSGFELTIESIHYSDRGTQENILELPQDVLKNRGVTVIDIANDPVSHRDYDSKMDPKIFKSTKTGRGLLSSNWMETVKPVMTCYKLVKVNFKWFGLQKRVEKYIQKFELKVFLLFHRRLFCSIDEWFGLTMEKIIQMEEEVRELLDLELRRGHVRGTYTTSLSYGND